ncbi:hypothetical protein SDC9_196327 [bioreactor metagenome]|uniref:Uncharacterized protein n=1 Tax=bioreactor metagenome TaxID=1076179 RepID=A0A645IBR7_9ZZZZ
MDHRLRFLAALLLAAEGHRPGGNQVLDRLGVDLRHRAEALTLGAEAEADHVADGFRVVEDVGIADRGAGRAAGDGERRREGEPEQVPGKFVTVHGTSPWLCVDSVAAVTPCRGRSATKLADCKPCAITAQGRRKRPSTRQAGG